jgi:protein gp37
VSTKIEWLKNPDGTPGETWDPIHRFPEQLEDPLHWRKPRRIFIENTSDLFQTTVPEAYIDHVLKVIKACPHHTFIALTKYPKNMQRKLYGEAPGARVRKLGGGDYLPNLWLGVTCENQQAADERIPILLQTPAAVRFISCEPLLSAIDLSHWLKCECNRYWPGQGHPPDCPTQNLHWCIVGDETGPGARPCSLDWVRSLRDQCQEAGTPFYFKSWGDWVHDSQPYPPGGWPDSVVHVWPDRSWSLRIGKKRAGRLLDGQEWNEIQEVE